MKKRAWIPVFFLLAAAVVLPSCQAVPPEAPPPEDPSRHDCLSYWGTDAAALEALLRERNAQWGEGWAKKVDSPSAFDAVNALHLRLGVALGQPAAPATRDPAAKLPTPPRLEELSLSVTQGLNSDAASMCHGDPPAPGWLLQGGLPEAIDQAWRLREAAKEALDM